MPFFERDGLRFHYRDEGWGTPFFFQHGLGGDVEQPFGVLTPPPGIRLLAFDCRGHGETRPLGDPEKLSFATFGDDLLALMDVLNVPCAIMGGISMGAALALRMALQYPARVLGLVLVRPAWLHGPNPDTVKTYGRIARLIRQYGAARGRERFMRSRAYAMLLERSPDVARSLVGQFTHPRAEETVSKLERIPPDRPYHDQGALALIAVPTLVLANRQDPIHPFAYGEILAQAIPTAVFKELTPKSVSTERHAADVNMFITQYVEHHGAAWHCRQS